MSQHRLMKGLHLGKPYKAFQFGVHGVFLRFRHFRCSRNSLSMPHPQPNGYRHIVPYESCP